MYLAHISPPPTHRRHDWQGKVRGKGSGGLAFPSSCDGLSGKCARHCSWEEPSGWVLCNHDEGHRLSCVDSIHVRCGKKTVYLQMPILEKAYNKTLLWLQKSCLVGAASSAGSKERASLRGVSETVCIFTLNFCLQKDCRSFLCLMYVSVLW